MDTCQVDTSEGTALSCTSRRSIDVTPKVKCRVGQIRDYDGDYDTDYAKYQSIRVLFTGLHLLLVTYSHARHRLRPKGIIVGNHFTKRTSSAQIRCPSPCKYQTTAVRSRLYYAMLLPTRQLAHRLRKQVTLTTRPSTSRCSAVPSAAMGIKLYYFPIAARAEPIRLVLLGGKVEFEVRSPLLVVSLRTNVDAGCWLH
jgi:hypothetical protein